MKHCDAVHHAKRDAACTGKIAYSRRWHAVMAEITMTQRTGEQFNTYKCEFCKKYHIGHKRNSRQETHE